MANIFGKDPRGQSTAQVIYLELDEDIISIRDRLDWVKAQRVILVIPKGNKALTNPIHMKLLLRKARDLALEVALVTRDALVRRLAREVGIPVFGSVARAKRSKPSKVSASKAQPLLSRVPGVPRATSLVIPREREGIPVWALMLIIIPFVVMVIIGSVLFIPSAQVKLSPLRETLNETITITADPNIRKIDYAEASVPARKVRMEITGRGNIPTTAKKDVPDAKATGTVVFINKTNQEVIIPMGTVVGTSTGVNIRFTTVDTATLPPAFQSRVEVGIVAVDPGPMGNVGAYLINKVEGALALQVQVLNPNPTSGGTVKQVNVVTKADKDRLKSIVLQKLYQQAYQAFLEKIPKDSLLIPQTINVIPTGESYDHFVDEVADELSLELKAVALGLTVNRDDLRALATYLMQDKVPEGYEMVEEKLSFEVVEAQKGEEGRYTVNLRVMGPVLASIDVNSIRDRIRGLPLEKAQEKLRALPLRKEPEVAISPDWFNRMPWLPFRINIRLEAEE
ncbi:MAG: hypothetical protein DRI61_00785 [Chloroflexi bacterium]|nr:MAG: hypothetical protein DRI61_00785 [Chloroflexota bacterium]